MYFKENANKGKNNESVFSVAVSGIHLLHLFSFCTSLQLTSHWPLCLSADGLEENDGGRSRYLRQQRNAALWVAPRCSLIDYFNFLFDVFSEEAKPRSRWEPPNFAIEMLILSDGCTIKFQSFLPLRPAFVSSLSAPKIPEGEKVDFDVSFANLNILMADRCLIILIFHSKQQLSGHSSQAHGEGPDGTPDSDRGPFWEAKEGGRGAAQPHRSNRTPRTFSHSALKWLSAACNETFHNLWPTAGEAQVGASRADEDQGREGEGTAENRCCTSS